MLMDWANGNCIIENLAHIPFVNKALEVKNKFTEISFSDIHREFNSEADRLFKEALTLQEGTLSEQEFKDGELQQQKTVLS